MYRRTVNRHSPSAEPRNEESEKLSQCITMRSRSNTRKTQGISKTLVPRKAAAQVQNNGEEEEEEEGFEQHHQHIEVYSHNEGFGNEHSFSSSTERERVSAFEASSKLPEANPLLKDDRVFDFQPRVLIKDVPMRLHPPYLNAVTKNVVAGVSESQAKATIIPIASQNSQELPIATDVIEENNALGGGASSTNKSRRNLTLYEKYVQSKKYKEIYRKVPETRTEAEVLRNFAGLYINLSHLLDFGNSMFQQLRVFKEIAAINPSDEQLVFDSRFESANLFAAFNRKENIYDLVLQNDVNTKGFTQWFYFCVTNTRRQRRCRFNIVNLSKGGSFFQKGMKIAIYSHKMEEERGVQWFRGGEKIQYFMNNIIKETNTEFVFNYYTLTWEYTFEYDNDAVFFALTFPYAYSQMIKHIDGLVEKFAQGGGGSPDNQVIVRKNILCFTISNNAVPIVTITSANTQNGANDDLDLLQPPITGLRESMHKLKRPSSIQQSNSAQNFNQTKGTSAAVQGDNFATTEQQHAQEHQNVGTQRRGGATNPPSDEPSPLIMIKSLLKTKSELIANDQEYLAQNTSGVQLPSARKGGGGLTMQHKKNKKIAIIIARQHPGETVSSFVMQGTIDFLVSNTREAKALRERYIFKILPMVNPDGVIYGNFRCNLAGVDINRQWTEPDKILHPEAFYFNNQVSTWLQQGKNIDFFIDLHGHSKKTNSFIYACKNNDPQQSLSTKEFPFIFSRLNDKFSFPDCTFGLSWYKETTARALMWYNINSSNVFTVETSFYGYSVSENKGGANHFSLQDLFNLGADLIRALYIYEVKEESEYANMKQQLITLLREGARHAQENDRAQGGAGNGTPFDDKETNDDSSGSDSDPQADELTIKEKLTNFIPAKIANNLKASAANQTLKQRTFQQIDQKYQQKKRRQKSVNEQQQMTVSAMGGTMAVGKSSSNITASASQTTTDKLHAGAGGNFRNRKNVQTAQASNVAGNYYCYPSGSAAVPDNTRCLTRAGAGHRVQVVNMRSQHQTSSLSVFQVQQQAEAQVRDIRSKHAVAQQTLYQKQNQNKFFLTPSNINITIDMQKKRNPKDEAEIIHQQRLLVDRTQLQNDYTINNEFQSYYQQSLFIPQSGTIVNGARVLQRKNSYDELQQNLEEQQYYQQQSPLFASQFHQINGVYKLLTKRKADLGNQQQNVALHRKFLQEQFKNLTIPNYQNLSVQAAPPSAYAEAVKNLIPNNKTGNTAVTSTTSTKLVAYQKKQKRSDEQPERLNYSREMVQDFFKRRTQSKEESKRRSRWHLNHTTETQEDEVEGGGGGGDVAGVGIESLNRSVEFISQPFYASDTNDVSAQKTDLSAANTLRNSQSPKKTDNVNANFSNTKVTSLLASHSANKMAAASLEKKKTLQANQSNLLMQQEQQEQQNFEKNTSLVYRDEFYGTRSVSRQKAYATANTTQRFAPTQTLQVQSTVAQNKQKTVQTAGIESDGKTMRGKTAQNSRRLLVSGVRAQGGSIGFSNSQQQQQQQHRHAIAQQYYPLSGPQQVMNKLQQQQHLNSQAFSGFLEYWQKTQELSKLETNPKLDKYVNRLRQQQGGTADLKDKNITNFVGASKQRTSKGTRLQIVNIFHSDFKNCDDAELFNNSCCVPKQHLKSKQQRSSVLGLD